MMDLQAVECIIAGEGKAGRSPELWNGHAAERFVQRLEVLL